MGDSRLTSRNATPFRAMPHQQTASDDRGNLGRRAVALSISVFVDFGWGISRSSCRLARLGSGRKSTRLFDSRVYRLIKI
jgi:hypothetical protein